MKNFKGKAIYNPSGKAGEYSYWACNFYVGCSNGCTYCYLKKGRGAAILGGDVPTLKKCFKDENHALEVFQKELKQNLPELQTHGLFFSFTTDPMLPRTIDLTMDAVMLCVAHDIPVKILTKTAFDIGWFRAHFEPVHNDVKGRIAVGFTLSGHDELELYASTNAERIKAMKILHNAGFKTFASIEPIIDLNASMEMIQKTIGFCDLYKVGLESGKKPNAFMLLNFVNVLAVLDAKFYLKESITKLLGEYMLPSDNFVQRDYNIFNQ